MAVFMIRLLVKADKRALQTVKPMCTLIHVFKYCCVLDEVLMSFRYVPSNEY